MLALERFWQDFCTQLLIKKMMVDTMITALGTAALFRNNFWLYENLSMIFQAH